MAVDVFPELKVSPELLEVPGQQVVCRKCGKVKPKSEFSVHHGNSYRTTCKACRKDQGSPKLKRIEQGIHRLVASAQNTVIHAPSLAEMAGGLIAELGGIQAVIHQWATQIQLLQDGTRLKVEQYQFIFRMLQATAADRREELDVTQLSEEELERAITGYALRVLEPEDEGEEGDKDRLEREAAEALERVSHVG